VGNGPQFAFCRARSQLSYDDYFPHNQNKNDLEESRSFLVRVERVELSRASTEKRHNSAGIGCFKPRTPGCKFHQVSTDLAKFRHLVGNPWATLRGGGGAWCATCVLLNKHNSASSDTRIIH
jgi:hypothetical protein